MPVIVAAIIFLLLALAAPCRAQINICPGATGTAPANGWCYDPNSRRFMSNFGNVWAPMTHTYDIGPQIQGTGTYTPSSQWPASACISAGDPVGCCTGLGVGATCSTAITGGSNLGIDPTSGSFTVKADARGAGPWFNTSGDGSFNSSDATCGTAGQCFSSASGNFTSADCHTGVGCTGPVDKIISINGISSLTVGGVAGIAPFVQTSSTVPVTVKTVQSSTQITLSAAPGIAAGAHTGLNWLLGTNNMSSMQTAISAGDLHIPAGTYLFWPSNTNQNPGTAGSAIFVPSYRDIYCDQGAVLVQVNFDPASETVALWDIGDGAGSPQNVVLRGCTMEGTNVASSGPSYDATNGHLDFMVFVDGITSTGQGSNVLLTNNTIKYVWGQAGIETSQSAATDYVQNVHIDFNNFQNCGIYGAVFVSERTSTMIGNTAVDCSMGIEGDNASATSQTTLIQGNMLTCVNGDGFNAPNNQTYLSGGNIAAHDYSTVKVINNTVSGSAPGTGYCAYLAGNGNDLGASHGPFYANDQCINGCVWR